MPLCTDGTSGPSPLRKLCTARPATRLSRRTTSSGARRGGWSTRPSGSATSITSVTPTTSPPNGSSFCAAMAEAAATAYACAALPTVSEKVVPSSACWRAAARARGGQLLGRGAGSSATPLPSARPRAGRGREGARQCQAVSSYGVKAVSGQHLGSAEAVSRRCQAVSRRGGLARP